MSKKIKLTISDPCHESWDAMTPVEKGKFCGSCQKQVVDFSNMSDRQIAEFFKKPSTGSVCGRFMTGQLDRDIDIPKKRLPWLRYFFQILLPAFFISKAGAQQKMGKVAMPVARDTVITPTLYQTVGRISPTIRPVITEDTVTPLMLGEITCTPKIIMIEIKGKVGDENGRPIEGATVTVKNTNNGVATDKRGRFSMKVREGDVLSVSSPGFISFETIVANPARLEIQLTKIDEVIMVAGMIAIDRRPERQKNIPVVDKNSTNVITTIDPEEFELIKNAESMSDLKVFPNPVSAGKNLSVSCTKLEPGNYSLQWLNQSGQVIKKENDRYNGKSIFINTSVPKVSSGTYFMVLTENKSGKRYSQKLIIQ